MGGGSCCRSVTTDTNAGIAYTRRALSRRRHRRGSPNERAVGILARALVRGLPDERAVAHPDRALRFDLGTALAVVQFVADNPVARTRPVRSTAGALSASSPLNDVAERVRLALGAVEMGTFVWDLAEDRAKADVTTLMLFGLAADATFHPLSAAAHVHADDRPRYLDAVLRAGDPVDSAVIEEDVRVVGFNDGTRWVRLTARTWWDGSPSRPRWCAGVAADVTSRKQRDDVLVRAALEKDEFFSLVAHELRNPLAPLRTALDLIRFSGDSVNAVARVRTIMERQIAQLGHLIDDLVEVGRMHAGTMQLRRVGTPVDEALQSALELTRNAMNAKSIQVSVDICREPAIVDADPTRLVHAVSRLLLEATRYIESAGTMVVTAVVHDAPPVVVVTIAAGREAPSRVVAPAATVDSSTSSARPGVGFTAARLLIELHGGTVEVLQGAPGRARALQLRLPAIVTEQGGAAATDERRSIGRHVLIIDDNEDAAHALAMLVWELGGDARVAYSGVAGLGLLEGFAPDVVLLDIGLSDLDGYETCRRIRRLLGAGVKIVAVSGFGLDRDKERAQLAGFDAHLTKPAEHGALARLLEAPAPSAERDDPS